MELEGNNEEEKEEEEEEEEKEKKGEKEEEKKGEKKEKEVKKKEEEDKDDDDDDDDDNNNAHLIKKVHSIEQNLPSKVSVHLIKKFPALYGTHMFITTLTTACLWTLLWVR